MMKKQYSTPNRIVGTVKKSIAAMASQWFRRKASQRFPRSGFLGTRFIHLETVRSEMSNPSMTSSPWMRGARHVGFSATMRKINSRTSWKSAFVQSVAGLGNQSPIHVKAGTVPADNSFRSDDDERLLPFRPQPANRNPEELVKQMKSWSRMASIQHNQLLP
jgi:hypothetical protein